LVKGRGGRNLNAEVGEQKELSMRLQAGVSGGLFEVARVAEGSKTGQLRNLLEATPVFSSLAAKARQGADVRCCW
jgi:hypothetical protein